MIQQMELKVRRGRTSAHAIYFVSPSTRRSSLRERRKPIYHYMKHPAWLTTDTPSSCTLQICQVILHLLRAQCAEARALGALYALIPQ